MLKGVTQVVASMTSGAPLNLNFPSVLFAFSVLLLFSIVLDKLSQRIGIPGSIFLFFGGLFFHLSGFSFKAFPLEELHVVALSILLFFSGLSFERRLLARQKLLAQSISLAVLGTVLTMLIWLFYFRIGFGIVHANFEYLPGVQPRILTLAAVIVVFSLSVQDWNSFAFVSKRIRGFRGVLVNIFKVETSVSASISVAFAELLVLAWIALNPDYLQISPSDLLVSIMKGLLFGILSGVVLGYLLMLTIRHLATERSQLILAAVAFTLLGYVVSFSLVHQAGYLCALVMGVVTSIAYRNCSTETEIEFLSQGLESLNIASEAILFFVIGLGLDAMAFIWHLPVALYVVLGVLMVRPLTVALFFRGSSLQPEEKRLLACWSPKGAISMALVVTAPALLEDVFKLEVTDLLPGSAYTFTSDVVCGAVILLMFYKSLLIPRLHPTATLDGQHDLD